MDWSTDEEVQWMLSAQTGDIKSFERILDRYQKQLLNFFFRFFNNPTLAEDATQQLFLQIYKSLPMYAPRSKLSTYIYRSAKNLAINIQRRNSILSFFGLDETEKISSFTSPVSENPEPTLEEKVRVERIQQALAALHPRQKIAVLLAYFENLSAEEIADRMDASISAVESLLFRAREKLKTLLQSEFENFSK